MGYDSLCSDSVSRVREPAAGSSANTIFMKRHQWQAFDLLLNMLCECVVTTEKIIGDEALRENVAIKLNWN